MIAEGGIILDWHTCDIYPERWPDLVVVLRCDHTLLWERLEKRYVFEYPYVFLLNEPFCKRISFEENTGKQ